MAKLFRNPGDGTDVLETVNFYIAEKYRTTTLYFIKKILYSCVIQLCGKAYISTNYIVMAQIKLIVNVQGGKAPVPITIFLDGASQHQKFQQPGSFSQTFELEPGEHKLMVGGLNPATGSTTAIIEGALNEEPIPGRQQSSNTKMYEFIFFITV